MPFAFSNAGLVGGMLGTAIVSLIYTYCIHIMVSFCIYFFKINELLFEFRFRCEALKNCVVDITLGPLILLILWIQLSNVDLNVQNVLLELWGLFYSYTIKFKIMNCRRNLFFKSVIIHRILKYAIYKFLHLQLGFTILPGSHDNECVLRLHSLHRLFTCRGILKNHVESKFDA
jgi:hypothetical protein